MSDGLAAVTVTPGSTAWLASTTFPLIDPVVLAPPPCANACVDASRHAASTAPTKTNPRRFMNALLFPSTHSGGGRCPLAVRFSDTGDATDRQTPCSTRRPVSLAPNPRTGNRLEDWMGAATRARTDRI